MCLLAVNGYLKIDEADRIITLVRQLSSQVWLGWPPLTPETQLVELRTLMDSSLVGNLRCGEMGVEGEQSFVFVDPPASTLAAALEKYGKPTQNTKLPDGSSSATYGRIRLAADKPGKIVLVLYSMASLKRP